MTQLYANPDCTTLTGFYFESFEEYEEKLEEAKESQNSVDFEHEIELIEGDSDLFNALEDEFPNWMEAFFELDEEEDEELNMVINYLICNVGYDFDDLEHLREKAEEVHIISSEGLEGYLLETLELPEHISPRYIDIESIKNDWDCNGDLCELGEYYVTNRNCF